MMEEVQCPAVWSSGLGDGGSVGGGLSRYRGLGAPLCTGGAAHKPAGGLMAA